MVTLNSTNLFSISIILLITAAVINPSQSLEGPKLEQIRKAICRLLVVTAISSIIAALVIYTCNSTGYLYLYKQNIEELNQTIIKYNNLLSYSWSIYVAILISVGVGIWAGWLDVKSSTLTIIPKVIKLTSAVKLLFGILASSSFILIGVGGYLRTGIQQAETVKQSLPELHVILFQHVRYHALYETIAPIIKHESQINPNISTLQTAYNDVIPYLSESRKAKFSANIGETIRSYSVIPDVSTERANLLIRTYEAPSKVTDELAESFIDLILDEKIGDSIKEHFLGIENPILSELTSTFTDPVLIEPIKNKINKIVATAITGNWSKANLINAVRPITAECSVKIGQNLTRHNNATNVSSVKQRLGYREWDKVRGQLKVGVSRGMNNEKASIIAKSAYNKFDKFWQNADKILVTPSERRVIGEKLFSAYLLRNPEFSALWGYAVIAFTPQEYKNSLRDISVQDLAKSDRIKNLRKVLSNSVEASKSEEMKEIIAYYSKVSDSSPSELTGRQIAKHWYDYHGPYPVDGYGLYFSKAGTSSVETATKYFNSEQVSEALNGICPVKPIQK